MSENTIDFQKLSEQQLEEMIRNAERTLTEKREAVRKDVIEQIQKLAHSIGAVAHLEEKQTRSARKGIKVPIKYRHPTNQKLAWTGRGVTPRWLQELIDQGHDRSEYEVKN